MKFELVRDGGELPIDVGIGRLLIAGFTARDRAAVHAHLEEVRHLGVQLPDRLPALYPSVASRLTQSPTIQVPTAETSGEVEVVFVQHGDHLLVAVGSDHTERSSEGVALIPSKSVCDKPISTRVWAAADVADHIEELELRCEVHADGRWQPYQGGPVSAFMPLTDLLEDTRRRAGWHDGDVLMCGTLPTAGGGLVYGTGYRMTLRDPRLDRELTLEYGVDLVEVDRVEVDRVEVDTDGPDGGGDGQA